MSCLRRQPSTSGAAGAPPTRPRAAPVGMLWVLRCDGAAPVVLCAASLALRRPAHPLSLATLVDCVAVSRPNGLAPKTDGAQARGQYPAILAVLQHRRRSRGPPCPIESGRPTPAGAVARSLHGQRPRGPPECKSAPSPRPPTTRPKWQAVTCTTVRFAEASDSPVPPSSVTALSGHLSFPCIGQSSAEIDRNWPVLADAFCRNWPNSAEAGQHWPNFGHKSAEVGQLRSPKSAQLGQFGLKSANV